jgi:hypothetical protein
MQSIRRTLLALDRVVVTAPARTQTSVFAYASAYRIARSVR